MIGNLSPQVRISWQQALLMGCLLLNSPQVARASFLDTAPSFWPSNWPPWTFYLAAVLLCLMILMSLYCCCCANKEGVCSGCCDESCCNRRCCCCFCCCCPPSDETDDHSTKTNNNNNIAVNLITKSPSAIASRPIELNLISPSPYQPPMQQHTMPPSQQQQLQPVNMRLSFAAVPDDQQSGNVIHRMRMTNPEGTSATVAILGPDDPATHEFTQSLFAAAVRQKVRQTQMENLAVPINNHTQ